jgi:hypothetical protein
MAKKRKYQSELLGAIYEEALADFGIGIISEERLRYYERECLVPEVPHVSLSAHDAVNRPPAPLPRAVNKTAKL